MIKRLPGPMPCMSPSGMSNTRSSRKPTTSAGTVPRPSSRVTSQTSPTDVNGPVPSITMPTAWATRPVIAIDSICSNRSVSFTGFTFAQGFPDAEQLGLEGRVDQPARGVDQATAAQH